MKNYFKYISIIFVIWFLMTPIQASDEELLGEGNDGNRTGVVHVIELYDDQGKQIKASNKVARPFSLKQTCGKCHDYETISSGWHFNSHNPDVPAGRPGQPWVLIDSKTRTQIPLSGRQWPGTFKPSQIKMTGWDFLNEFYSHFPGGSYGEMVPEDPGIMIRKEISGNYEINCLACHHNSPQEDQSMAALQSARQNYRWIPAASSGKAVVNGVAYSLDEFFDPEFDEGIALTYADGIFDKEDKVFFDVSGKPTNERCYFCHSNQDLRVEEKHRWTQDEDVHLKSGLNCVDCHRNGNDHMITRGIETEGIGRTLTCEGCHVDSHEVATPENGRLGAPNPKHAGIPTIHFEKLTCTACHSGTWPVDNAGRWKTARMHKTGLHGKHNLDIRQPHVYAPVLMKGDDDKIGPYKLFWPSYWATKQDDNMVPIAPKNVLDAAKNILGKKVDKVDDWRPLTDEQIAGTLKVLSTEEKQAVYIAGGKLYKLKADKLVVESSELAKPYAWPMAHDVRPTEQALGIRSCKDCHTTDSAFFFGNVEVDTPVISDDGPEFVEMIELQGVDRLYMWAFNASFVFRPMLKVVAFGACALIALVLLAYMVKAVGVVSMACTKEGK